MPHDLLPRSVNKTQKSKTLVAADLWCGGGGSSSGLVRAVQRLGYNLELTAVNHWNIAVATHSKNHPNARHFCKAVDSVNPLELYPGRELDLLLASPECTHHSKARGGKPRDDQKRADAWDLQRWLEKLYVRTLIIENVPEFTSWGPLDKNGDPLKSKKGVLFKQFIDFLKILYTVEWRILNCADYGDPTTRERFFLIAKRGKNKKIFFPEPTHASRKEMTKAQQNLFTKDLKPHVSAREIINWNIPGRNVFGRSKDLVPNTMRRIYAGLRKYSGIDIPERPVFIVKSLFDLLEKKKRKNFSRLEKSDFIKKLKKLPEFIVPDWEVVERDSKGKVVKTCQHPSFEELDKIRLQKQKEADETYLKAPIKLDLSKIKISSGTPFLVNQKATDRRMRDINDPTFTQTTKSQHQYLAQPFCFFFNMEHQGREAGDRDSSLCYPMERSVPTIAGKGMFGLVEPLMIKYHGNETNGRSVDEPFSTLTTKDRLALCQPFLVKFYGGHTCVSPEEPIATANFEHYGLCEPVIVPVNHGAGDKRSHSLDETMKTVTAFDAFGFVQSYIVKFNNNQDAKDINDPIPTITSKEKIGLGQPFLLQFFGERIGQEPRTRNIESPVWTVTPQIRMGIVEPFLVKVEDLKGTVINGLLLLELGCLLIINFRMLHETELAAAMSFPPDYYFAGTREEIVRQIGNAVPVFTMEALAYTALRGGK